MLAYFSCQTASDTRLPIPVGASLLTKGLDDRFFFAGTSVSGTDVPEPIAIVEYDGTAVWLVSLVADGICRLCGSAVREGERVQVQPGEAVLFGVAAPLVLEMDPAGTAVTPPRDQAGANAATLTTLSYSPPVPEGAPPGRVGFGFEANDVEFRRQGIGTSAASKLAERFRPIQVVSSGGMGKVILVQETLSGRFAAMKIMLESAARDNSLVQQFVREAVITARLQHPHILPVYDLGFLDGDQLYFTMAYVDGESFRAVMPRLDLPDRVRVIRCAALAAAHAHARGLYHRDIKPHNILVGPVGDAYLIDWGLVSVRPGCEYRLNIPKIVVDRTELAIPDTLMEQTDGAITASNQFALGTPQYMAPEQCTRDAPRMGAASDVWSLGIVLFEALTGRHPLVSADHRSPIQIMSRVVTEPVPNPDDVAPGVPPELGQLCTGMLNKDPGGRFQDMRDVIAGLTGYLKAHTQSVGTGALLTGFNTDARIVSPRVDDAETARIAAELARSQAKNKLLLELAQLGLFQSRRRRELWAQLAAL
jgi:serine/threonine protein kinase